MGLFGKTAQYALGAYLAASLTAQPPYRTYRTPDGKYECALLTQGDSASAVCKSSRADPKKLPRETFIDDGNDGLLDIFTDNGDGISPPRAFLINPRVPDGKKLVAMMGKTSPYDGSRKVLLQAESANPRHPDSVELQRKYIEIRTDAGVPDNGGTKDPKRLPATTLD